MRALATASQENHDCLRQLGADVTIDYHIADASKVALEETEGRGVDAAFDIADDNIVSRGLPGIHGRGKIVLQVVDE
jgi:NADPH:quinone reductase-like Zn-dependent oxidoreductase